MLVWNGLPFFTRYYTVKYFQLAFLHLVRPPRRRLSARSAHPGAVQRRWECALGCLGGESYGGNPIAGWSLDNPLKMDAWGYPHLGNLLISFLRNGKLESQMMPNVLRHKCPRWMNGMTVRLRCGEWDARINMHQCESTWSNHTQSYYLYIYIFIEYYRVHPRSRDTVLSLRYTYETIIIIRMKHSHE